MDSHADHPPVSQRDDEAVDLLLRFVHERDVACPLCGYNLRNLTQPTCPECEESLSLKVDVTRLAIAPLLITLAPGGFCLIAFGIFVVMCMLHGLPPMRETGLWLTIGFLLLSGVSAIALAMGNRVFMRLAPGARATIALLTWAVHILIFLVLVTTVM